MQGAKPRESNSMTMPPGPIRQLQGRGASDVIKCRDDGLRTYLTIDRDVFRLGEPQWLGSTCACLGEILQR